MESQNIPEPKCKPRAPYAGLFPLTISYYVLCHSLNYIVTLSCYVLCHSMNYIMTMSHYALCHSINWACPVGILGECTLGAIARGCQSCSKTLGAGLGGASGSLLIQDECNHKSHHMPGVLLLFLNHHNKTPC